MSYVWFSVMLVDKDVCVCGVRARANETWFDAFFCDTKIASSMQKTS